MEIYPVKDGWKENVYEHEHFPLPARILLVGRSQMSGKTTFLTNLLLRPEFLGKDVFKGEDCFIMAPSIERDAKLQFIVKGLQIPKTNQIQEFSEPFLQRAMHHFRKSATTGKQQLLILDDVASHFKGAHEELLQDMFTMGRHLGLTIVATAQKYSQIPTTFRENATHMIMWSASENQADLAAKDFSFGISRSNFKELHDTATQEQHGFLMVNLSRQPHFWNSHFEAV